MPPILAREYELPYLDGRAFVDALRAGGGWDAVDDAWSDPPRAPSRSCIRGGIPTTTPSTSRLAGLESTLGDGWSEQWQQTMGEARIGVWLADGAAPDRPGPTAPPDMVRAGAAAGWGGDDLVSLAGPGDSWAIVWQTEWDSADDASQFASAAVDVVSDLPGAHAVLDADVAGGLSAPVLVLVTSDADTLAAVSQALGFDYAPPPIQRRSPAAYIDSGAEMPRRPSALRRASRVTSTSASRLADVSGSAGSTTRRSR